MKLRAGIGVGVIAAFFAALTLASAPQLHEYLHKSDVPHECAATIVASGHYHHAPPPSVIAIAPLVPVASVDRAPQANLTETAVPLSVLEHAPPSAI